MSSQQPMLPVPLPPAEKVRSFLGWAFVISVGLHLLLGPILGLYKPPREDKAEVEKVSVTHKIKVIVPTPPPPTPPPTPPPPKQTPPPVHSTNPPPQPKIKLNVVHTTSKSTTGSSEHRYVAPAAGSENGVPQGTAATGPVSTAPPATAPPATPAPTPKPACANPHVDATVTRPVEPDYPDIARQQGATGTVQVKVTLTASGSVAGASVYKSSGNVALDGAAVKAAQESSYAAEVDECQPTAGSYLFRADFTGQ
ncbi:MAG: energy transducer TonB [Vulcanimicrobiaceae bacterium]